MAILLLDGIVQDTDKLRLTAQEKDWALPKLYVDLATLLVQAAQYEKAAAVCESALELFKRLNNVSFAPVAAYTLGECYHKMNKDKQKYMYWLTVACHAARGMGQKSLADKIREEYNIS